MGKSEHYPWATVCSSCLLTSRRGMSALLSGINRPESEMRSSDLKLPARAAPASHPWLSLIDCIALSCGVSQLIRGLMCCMYVCGERQTAGGQGWSEQPLQDTSRSETAHWGPQAEKGPHPNTTLQLS